MAIMNDDDELFNLGLDDEPDLGFELANTRRKRRLFVPYENAAMDPQTEQLSKYEEHIKNQPIRGESKTRDKLLGALISGLSAAGGDSIGNAVSEGNSVRDRGYNSAMENWKLKGAGLHELVQSEEARNRTSLYTANAQNKFHKDVEELMLRADEAERKTQDTQDDNLRADRVADASIGNFASLATDRTERAGRDKQRLGLEGERIGQGKERLSLETQRLEDQKKRTGLLSDKADKVKASQPAAKAKAINMATAALTERNPKITELLSADDKTLNEKQRKAKATFIQLRNHLAQKYMDSNEIPEADEMSGLDDEGGSSWFERLFGGSSEEGE